jgi:hypothetical protein
MGNVWFESCRVGYDVLYVVFALACFHYAWFVFVSPIEIVMACLFYLVLGCLAIDG